MRSSLSTWLQELDALPNPDDARLASKRNLASATMSLDVKLLLRLVVHRHVLLSHSRF
jgi:hypothetical protein